MMKLVMDEALPEKGSYILNIGKVDLLPSKKTLTVAEVNLLIERKDDCLANLLAPLRADYDYILVDTGPSVGSLTINAFTAADEIIIPVDPELFALVGLKELTETISKIKQNLNPKVEIIGILFTKCSKRTTLYRQTSEQVRSVFSHLPIFESQIPATVQVGTANSKGLSVMELDAKSPAAYMNLQRRCLRMPKINPRISSLDDLLGVAREVENTATAVTENKPAQPANNGIQMLSPQIIRGFPGHPFRLYDADPVHVEEQRQKGIAEADKLIANKVLEAIRAMLRKDRETSAFEYAEARKAYYTEQMICEILMALEQNAVSMGMEYDDYQKAMGGDLSKAAKKEWYLRHKDKGMEP